MVLMSANFASARSILIVLGEYSTAWNGIQLLTDLPFSNLVRQLSPFGTYT